MYTFKTFPAVGFCKHCVVYQNRIEGDEFLTLVQRHYVILNALMYIVIIFIVNVSNYELLNNHLVKKTRIKYSVFFHIFRPNLCKVCRYLSMVTATFDTFRKICLQLLEDSKNIYDN